MKQFVKILGLSLLAISLLGSCGDDTAKKDPHAGHNTAADAPKSMIAETSSQEWILEGNDDMKFNLSEIKVKAGQPVKITLKHTGKLGKEVMGHNLVVLVPGTDLAAFGNKAVAAKETDYIPATEKAAVIAHSALIGGGESTTLEFTLPEKGNYDFLCSFPGHFAMMKGVIIAE